MLDQRSTDPRRSGTVAQCQPLPTSVMFLELTDVPDTVCCSFSVDAAADAVTALEYDDVDAVTVQDGGSTQAGNARAYHDDLFLRLRSWVASLHTWHHVRGGQAGGGEWDSIPSQAGADT